MEKLWPGKFDIIINTINIIICILNIIIIIVIKSINIKNRKNLKKKLITIIIIIIVKKNLKKILIYKLWSDKFNIIINMIKYYYLSYKYLFL
jgi:hypothetical protein